MAKSLTICLAILLCAGVAHGQAGHVSCYDDSLGMDTCFWDSFPGIRDVYVIHKATPGATASQWMVVNNGMQCTYLSESSPLVKVGSAFSGISVSYGGCLPGDIVLLKITFYCLGSTPNCAYLEVVGDPITPTGMVEVIDCSSQKLLGVGGRMYVNPDATCNYDWCVFPVEGSSWGRVKSLYR